MKKTERRGRKKVASRDLKKNVTIRLRDITREVLEDDFDGKIQHGIDFLCAFHIKERTTKSYMKKVEAFLNYLSGRL